MKTSHILSHLFFMIVPPLTLLAFGYQMGALLCLIMITGLTTLDLKVLLMEMRGRPGSLLVPRDQWRKITQRPVQEPEVREIMDRIEQSIDKIAKSRASDGPKAD